MALDEVLNPLRYGRAIAASALHSFPSNKMCVIGVTGTDGKTTTTSLIYHILKSQKKKVGLISTIAAKIFDGSKEEILDTGFHVTTPDSFNIQKLLKKMVDSGCMYAVVEATSHAFAQERLAGINFDIGVVTNISHEHLDYHKTLERYVLAKAQLFRRDSNFYARKTEKSVAILNTDDASWDLLKPYTQDWSVVGYGFNDFSKFRIGDPTYFLDHTEYTLVTQDDNGNPLETFKVRSPLIGEYNAYNVSAAISACFELGVGITECIASLESFGVLPGRFERHTTKSHGLVVVDFAHTPNALEQILTFVRPLVKGKVIIVFGSAGLRDREKRFLMGEIAGKNADISIITAEDPRTERVEDISAEIARGVVEGGAEAYPAESMASLDSAEVRHALYEHIPLYMLVTDRRKAIITGVGVAGPDDVVLICGKGHETSMCYGTEERPWSDQAVVKEAIQLFEG